MKINDSRTRTRRGWTHAGRMTQDKQSYKSVDRIARAREGVTPGRDDLCKSLDDEMCYVSTRNEGPRARRSARLDEFNSVIYWD